MKYHRLYIDTDGTIGMYNKITEILGLEPSTIDLKAKFGEPYSLWTYAVDTNEEEAHFDFINKFLDVLEPKINELQNNGVSKDKILFWLIYEYTHQCSLSFDSQEMKRLGESGIHLNIDCRRSK
jgi:hypothetical protein